MVTYSSFFLFRDGKNIPLTTDSSERDHWKPGHTPRQKVCRKYGPTSKERPVDPLRRPIGPTEPATCGQTRRTRSQKGDPQKIRATAQRNGSRYCSPASPFQNSKISARQQTRRNHPAKSAAAPRVPPHSPKIGSHLTYGPLASETSPLMRFSAPHPT